MLAVLEFYANAQNWETVYAGSAADGTQGPSSRPLTSTATGGHARYWICWRPRRRAWPRWVDRPCQAGEMAGEKRREDIRTMSSRRFEVTIGCRFGPASTSR